MLSFTDLQQVRQNLTCAHLSCGGAKKKFTQSNCVPGWYLYPPSREPLAAMHLILEYCSETDDAQFIGVGI
jgi:hypothetical protein